LNKSHTTSKKNRINPPINIKPIERDIGAPLLIKLIKRCPATMLAARRTDNVIGRIKFLTSSIITIRGIKAPGVPVGTKWIKKDEKAFKK
jgi:hypothetical protein